ncbi:MAG TPA: MerR family transcriptional regulator [Pseudonocardiaceae bacterium]|nr:MerR family transcriptional regulator [Pseudonocardiaceae bacterium]
MLTIGQLSEATGIPTSTLRFWERKGLLTADARKGGQRRYTEEALTKVALLRLCQDAGWTLAEIGQIVRERLALAPNWRDTVSTKMNQLEAEITQLNHAHKMLEDVLECPHADITQCPKFREALEHRKGIPVTLDLLKSELPACGHALGDLTLGHEGQERDGAGQQHQQAAHH